jgi:hypothetical protein
METSVWRGQTCKHGFLKLMVKKRDWVRREEGLGERRAGREEGWER